jgi:hypothetical protein
MSTREKVLGSKMDASDAERQECVTLLMCIPVPVLSAEDTQFQFFLGYQLSFYAVFNFCLRKNYNLYYM